MSTISSRSSARIHPAYAPLLVLGLLAGCRFQVDRQLAPGEIRGRVVALQADGKVLPVSGADVELRAAHLRVRATEDGAFVVRGLPGAICELRITTHVESGATPTAGLRVSVDTSEAAGGGKDLGDLVLQRLAAIEGQVLQGDSESAGAKVVLDGEGVATADPHGHFVFPALLASTDHPSTHLLAVSAGGTAVAEGEALLAPGKTTNVELRLDAGSARLQRGSVSGRVRLAGKPEWAGIDVALVGEGTQAAATTGPEGTFEAVDVPTGIYRIVASHADFVAVELPPVFVGGDTVLVPDIVLPIRDGTCGIASADQDKDSVGDACDDCPEIADAEQKDDDHDRIGDACQAQAPDRSPPTVAATTPADGATDVLENSSIHVSFSEPVRTSTVTAATFFVAGPVGSLPVVLDLDADGAGVTFIPEVALASRTEYEVVLADGIVDPAGNPLAPRTSHFTTGDTRSPTISSLAPDDLATGVLETAVVRVRFSEPVRASSVTSTSFIVRASGQPIAGELAVEPAGDAATFTATGGLASLTGYDVALSEGITDLTGNAMVPRTWRFTTGDTHPPVLVARTPDDGATAVSPLVEVVVTFNEALDPASAIETNFYVDYPGRGSSTVTSEGSAVRLHLAQPLAYSTTFVVHATTGLRDTHQNALASGLTWSFTTAAAPVPAGTADGSFGSGGFVTLSGDGATGMVVDPQGRLVITGTSRDGGGSTNVTVWRLLPDGTADATFGTAGRFRMTGTAFGSSYDAGQAVIVDHAGRIVVAGQSNNTWPINLALWRLTPDGALDTTFHRTGSLVMTNTTGGSAGYDYPYALVEDAGLGYLVTGFSKFSETGSKSQLDMVLWRFTESGDLDASGFGAPAGFVKASRTAGGAADNYWDQGSGLALDSLGRIVVAGFSNTAVLDQWGTPRPALALWRFSSAGQPDATFGTGGAVVVSGSAGATGAGVWDSASSVAIDGQDRIVAAGVSYAPASVGNVGLWRFASDGTADPTFNGTGFFGRTGTAAAGGTYDYAAALALDASGRAVTTGTSVAGGWFMGTWRNTSSGAADATFGTAGAVTRLGTAGATGASRSDAGQAVAIDARGRIVVAGVSNDASGTSLATVWRFLP
jgi:uncharacterized delta-60 repeat protein